MKKLTTIFAVITMMLALSSSVLAGTIQIDVKPADVPDETLPRVNVGDAPAGFGPDSWQGPATGKTNLHARYIADGDALSYLFPADAATMTIADLNEISYFTKRPSATPAGRDWWVQIYTRPQVGDDASWWYHERYINNYNSHTATNTWTQYSTDAGAMTFNSNGHVPSSTELTLTELINSNGSDLIEMVSIQTDSGWNGFDGYIDGMRIELNNGNVGIVNLVPEPATICLLGLGALSLIRRKRRA